MEAVRGMVWIFSGIAQFYFFLEKEEISVYAGLEKKLNSSLSFGQMPFTFFLPRATSCLS